MADQKWTIGIVNYKSSVYLKYQMKILYEFNDANSFKVIIIDNSFPHEKKELSAIKKEYSKYNNIDIVYFNASKEPWMRGSGQHGEGLNEVLKRTDTKYLLVHDPDFFFVKKNYLEALENKIELGNLVVGAPYRNFRGHIETGNIGKADFPSAFGAVYKVSAIKGMDFMPSVSEKSFKDGKSCWIEPDGADVGWQMRNKLSNKKYLSFDQKFDPQLKYIFGNYSFQQEPYKYFLDNELIAYHLFRGTFVDDDRNFSTANIEKQTPKEWNKVREKCGTHFYKITKNGLSFSYIFGMCFRYYVLNIMIIDEILGKLVYIPIYKIFVILNKFFFKITHPVGFIKRKLKKLKR